MKVPRSFLGLIISISLFSCSTIDGTLEKRESKDLSLMIMKIGVTGPMSFGNNGKFSLLNIDTGKVYSSSFTDNHYSMIMNVPVGKYIISQLVEPIQTGTVTASFSADSSEITREYRMNGIYALAAPSINKTTDNVITVFEVKNSGVYYLGDLSVTVAVGIKVSNKYDSVKNDTVDKDIRKMLNHKDWYSRNINSLIVFSKKDFRY